MPLSHIDLKSIAKVSGRAPVTLPSDAMTKGIAKGSDGNKTGVYGESEQSTAIYGKSPIFAGFFQGDVYTNGNLTVDGAETHTQNLFVVGNIDVSGDIQMTNADIAEDFDIFAADIVQPGTVMVFSDDGRLRESRQAYDKRVAGVISGAGSYKPGLVLDKQGTSRNRRPVALMGKVFCKVDAQFGAIEVGDLLTTSHTPGHAMKASDHRKSFGCILGKALRQLTQGVDLIPVLVALQ